ncbi:MAG TPA: DUF4926 domain-containing protein [Tepidisphaeraceae bacterium]|jgi:hypothetical protein|nr:DUF4926 domain-containing protein [Tepidisphaeraceae bacterium]
MNEPIHEFEMVALLAELPEYKLPAGQTGAVVFVHDGGKAFEVEFPLTPRQSVVATVARDQLLLLKGTANSRTSV